MKPLLSVSKLRLLTTVRATSISAVQKLRGTHLQYSRTLNRGVDKERGTTLRIDRLLTHKVSKGPYGSRKMELLGAFRGNFDSP